MLALNEARLVRTRLRAQIQPAGAKLSVGPDGRARLRPGSGGVVPGIALGSPARGPLGDHVEPGVSFGHPEPAAYHAVRFFSCVGNPVTMLDGPAAGAKGVVYGKHGPVLAMFSPEDTARMAPGEWAVIEAQGVGLACDQLADLTCHSCSPQLLKTLIRVTGDGRLMIEVAAILPSIAAAAGIGMPAAMFNMDLNSSNAPVAELAKDLRFGDIVAVLDQDHRHGRRHRRGWTMIGAISHGVTVGGGHGFGLMTLLTAPSDKFALTQSRAANLSTLLPLPWSAS